MQHRAVRAGDGEVLGHHLAEHHVQVDDDRERDDERDRVRQLLGSRPTTRAGLR